jgi:hypothetical protein
LAFANLTTWATLATIGVASIKAHLEFQGTNAKISRYASIVHALLELNQWWDELPSHERFVVANIDKLVAACEDQLLRELRTWKSTSQVIKLLDEIADRSQK